jgi:alpha-D-ribose 1-methylphosphonate 5-triphosphate synthase subunit PhnH
MAGQDVFPAAAVAGFDPVFGSQATFRVVLDAMARPGTIGNLPVADPTTPLAGTGYLTALLRTLLDHEVSFAVVAAPDDAPGARRLIGYLTETTGSRPQPIAEADYVVALGPLPPGLALCLKRGDPAYPDRGATLLCLVPPLGQDGAGLLISLAGPGLRPENPAWLRLPGLTLSDLTALAAANAEPPCGIDLILLDASGRLVCLPRSTRLTRSPAF